MSSRWRFTIACLTCGWTETCEAAIVTSGDRIFPPTGSPLSRIESPSKSILRLQASSPSRLQSLALLDVYPQVARREGDAAIQSPGVEVGEPEGIGNAAGHG
jgi:hypothetical protein